MTKQVLYSPIDIADADFENLDREPSEDELEFQKFKDEFKQANEYAKVSVYRQPTTSDGRPGQKNLTFLFEAGVEEYTFSQLAGKLRDEYGSGTYRVQLRDKENLMKMNRAVSIEAPKIAGDENAPGNIISQVSRIMQEQQIRTENMFRQISGPQTSGDAIDQIIKITTAIAPILTALGIARPDPAPPPKTLTEQLTEFQMIRELFGNNDNDGPGGDANLYSLLGETVKAFGGPIAAAIAAGAQSGELNQDGVVALPAPATTELEKVTDQQKHDMAMRKNIQILIQNAKTGIDPEAFAGILVNNTPEDKADELFDFISAEKCVDTIIEIEPAAEHYREWFDALRLAVIEIMAEPEKVHEEFEKELQKGKDILLKNPTKEKPYGDLQPPEDENTIPESEAVAGADLKETPASASESDSDTPSDT